ncbi:hypothetical protein BIY26_20790 [Brenneria goodwinii]|uniref:Uncharacterized protein n=1 Tax=Brenneria goodwinii TaxID=1109412 RepID=A0AAE8JLA8_9GAMM|nr:hypothetical protein AWC36_15825 [Brenneria goodwinii]RLM17381.1 hypothetical protein BIY26_20790 [Brenneria goodwinii]
MHRCSKAANQVGYKVTINSRHDYPVVPNLLNRAFNLSATNIAWASDSHGRRLALSGDGD